MPRFAANLTMMFTEIPFLDRFAAAQDAGFDAVEYLFPYDHRPEEIASRLERNNLTQALFNMPPGDWAKGERGIGAIPGREDEFRMSVLTALRYAEATGVKRLHMMAGLASLEDSSSMATYRSNIAYAADALGQQGIDVLLEPINSRNMPGYALNSVDRAVDIINGLSISNLKLQFDIYHCQIIHGDVTMRLRATMPIIGHVQIASVPSRNEPDREELNYPFLFNELDQLGYSNFVGCEYNPRGKTEDGLNWFQSWRR